MALRNAKYLNQYDFSGGIRLDAPPHLIDDTEVFANKSSYDGTVNAFWDTGLQKRKGTKAVNTSPGLNLIKYGNCESDSAPRFSSDSHIVPVSGGTWARSTTTFYAGTHSWKLTHTAGDTAIAHFNGSDTINAMHGLTAGTKCILEGAFKSNNSLPARFVLTEYVSGGWVPAITFTIPSTDTWVKFADSFTVNSIAQGTRLSLNMSGAAGKYVYVDEVKVIVIADYITSGIRFYRSVAPTETMILAVSFADATRIFYLDGTALTEITGGSVIPTKTVCEFTAWKDCLYVATGSTYIQKITYSSGWTRVDLPVVPTSTKWMPSHILQHKDRLFIAGGDMPVGYAEGSALESDISFAGDSLDGAAYFFGYLDGDPITRLASFQNSVVVYKKDSIYGLEGDNATNWFEVKVQRSIGCVAPGSVADVGFGQIFLSADNIYFFDGTNVAAIGTKIKPWLDAIPFDMRSLAVATYHNNYYRIAFAKSSSVIYNDFELILDIPLFKQGKTSWWSNSGRNIAQYITADGPGDANTLFMVDGSLPFIRQLDVTNQDDGANITFEVHSKYFVFGQPNIQKIYNTLKIDHSIGIGVLDIEVLKNLNNEYSIVVPVDTIAGGNIYSSATLGTTFFTSQDNSRSTEEIALPSELDGYAIAYHITHDTDEPNVKVYGFSLDYAQKAF